jgi:hypothetical protein
MRKPRNLKQTALPLLYFIRSPVFRFRFQLRVVSRERCPSFPASIYFLSFYQPFISHSASGVKVVNRTKNKKPLTFQSGAVVIPDCDGNQGEKRKANARLP